MPQVLKHGLLKVTIFWNLQKFILTFLASEQAFLFGAELLPLKPPVLTLDRRSWPLVLMKTLAFDRNKLLMYSVIGSVSLGASFCKETKNIFTLPCPPFPLSPVQSSLSPVPSSLSPVRSSPSPVRISPRMRPTPRKLP